MGLVVALRLRLLASACKLDYDYPDRIPNAIVAIPEDPVRYMRVVILNTPL